MIDGWPKALAAPFGPYRGTVLRVIDGDTLVVELNLGFNVRAEIDVRIFGINAPELHGKSKAEGEAARDYLRSLLPPGTPVRVTTLPASSGEQTRSFVRYVARIERADDSEHALGPFDVAYDLVVNRHAIWVDRHLRPTVGPPPFGE